MPRTAGVNAGGWTKRGNRDRRETGTGDLQSQIYIYRETEREKEGVESARRVFCW